MKKLGELVTSKSKLETRELVTSCRLTSVQVRERALGIADGLTSTEHPNDMTAWYCKAYRVLGESRYATCASLARQPDVRSPKKLFGYLIKQEMAART